MCPLAPLTLLISAVGWGSIIVSICAISIAMAAAAGAISIVPLCEADLSSCYSATPTLTPFLRNGTEENKEFLYANMTMAWLRALLSGISGRLWSLCAVRIVFYELGKMGLYDECYFGPMMALTFACMVGVYNLWCFRSKHVENIIVPECKKAATFPEATTRNAAKMNNEGASKLIRARLLCSADKLKNMAVGMYPPLSTVRDISPQTCFPEEPASIQAPPPTIYCRKPSNYDRWCRTNQQPSGMASEGVYGRI